MEEDKYSPQNESDYYNYMYFPYNLPTPTGEIPNFGAWFLYDGDDYIKVDSDMIVNSEDIVLHARVGKTVTIEANVDDNQILPGEVVIVKDFDSGTRIKYPHINEYFVATDISLEDGTVLINKDGSFAKSVPNYTDENGMWISDDVPEVLYADWIEPKLVGGSILYKNKNIGTKYAFYDEDYNLLKEDDKTAIPTYTGGNGIPYYYAVDGNIPLGDDINNHGYVVVYDKNGEESNQRFIGGTRDQQVYYFYIKVGFPKPILDTIGNIEIDGKTMTDILINNSDKEIPSYNQTIAYWVEQVRETSGLNDWFVPGSKELEFMKDDIYTHMLLDFLNLKEFADSSNVLWTSSCQSDGKGHGLSGDRPTIDKTNGWDSIPGSPVAGYRIFIMRLI